MEGKKVADYGLFLLLLPLGVKAEQKAEAESQQDGAILAKSNHKVFGNDIIISLIQSLL